MGPLPQVKGGIASPAPVAQRMLARRGDLERRAMGERESEAVETDMSLL